MTASTVDLTFTITDNGRGIGKIERASGVANLQARATAHGGSCAVEPAPAGGTMVKWKALIA